MNGVIAGQARSGHRGKLKEGAHRIHSENQKLRPALRVRGSFPGFGTVLPGLRRTWLIQHSTPMGAALKSRHYNPRPP